MKRYLIVATVKRKINLIVRGEECDTLYDITAETYQTVDATSVKDAVSLYLGDELEPSGEDYYPFFDDEIPLPDACVRSVVEEGDIIELIVELSASS